MGRRKTKIVVTQNTKEWERQRSELIGASEVSSIFQCNPWMTRHRLLGIKAGVVDADEPTFRMDAGHYFEEGIGKLTQDYSYRQDVKLETMERDNCIRVDYELPYVSASLDFKGTTSDGRKYVLDCKCVGVNSYRTLKNSSVPSYTYWLQIQQQIMVTEKSLDTQTGYLATWAGNQMLKVYEIKPCVTTQTLIRKLSKHFYGEVQKLRRIASFDERNNRYQENASVFSNNPEHDQFYDEALQDYMPNMDSYIQNTSSIYMLVE